MRQFTSRGLLAVVGMKASQVGRCCPQIKQFMIEVMDTTTTIEGVLQRRDKILVALTGASEVFLRGSLVTWQENVFQVIKDVGHRLDVGRVFVCKHNEVTAEHVITSLRYAWQATGDVTQMDVPGLQQIHFQEAGFGRWAGKLYEGGVVSGRGVQIPQHERTWFVSSDVQTLIVVPVFVEREWWGLVGFENYGLEGNWSEPEIEAFKTFGVLFGAAIRRKRMEESLQHEQQSVMQKIKQIEDLAKFTSEDPLPVMRVSYENVVFYANRAAQPLLDSKQVTVGGTVTGDWTELVERVREKQQSEEIDHEAAGQVYSLLFAYIPDEAYVNVYGREVTREREAAVIKTQFMAMASHQLRTPLTSLRWYSELVQQKLTEADAEVKEMVDIIHQTTVKLAELVDDLLSISRIERGKVELEIVQANLGELTREIVSDMKVQAQTKGLVFEVEVAPELQPFWFDPKLIREVIVNLVSNAIKYTPDGGRVQVRVTLGESQVLIEVEDSGMGISEGDKQKIFGRFFRSQRAVESGIDGTGLGLSVAKLIVEKCGGRIWFESEENVGTRFFVTLPYRKNL
jgi:signal transduction histidine kinase